MVIKYTVIVYCEAVIERCGVRFDPDTGQVCCYVPLEMAGSKPPAESRTHS